MPSDVTTCPDIVELEQYVRRDADDGTIASIDAHVTSCAECAGQVEDLRENLKVESVLRRDSRAPGVAPAQSEEMSQLSRVGPYRIVRKLGQGGMGAVYEAEQESPRRVIALKMIRPGLVSRALLQRFKHESQILGRLKHPGIAQIYEAGTHVPEGGGAPQPYFALEAIHGPPLLAYAEQRGLDVRGRLELLAAVCDAVQHAHQRGVIHRDLKPDNILVDTSTTPPQPKILDFGVARVIDPDSQHTTLHTSAGQIVGTVAYMSPEQAAGDPAEIDTRSDVYALGVIAYQLLCGKLPHKVSPASVAESVRTIVQDEPTPLHGVDRSLRGDVSTIVGKALTKEKSRRYQSAAEMAADLRRHLRDEPISAHPPSTIYQLGKFARRNKGLVAGVAAAFVVLILGIVGTSIGLVRAERARAVAADHARRAQREADKQTAVNAFLQEMLASANPRAASRTNTAVGRNISVFEVMAEAGKRLDDGALRGQPGIELAVRLTLGKSFIELGEYASAVEHLTAALELAESLHGPRSSDAADATNSLAYVLRLQGKPLEAEKMARSSLEVAREVLGPEHRETAVCMNTLAMILEDMGHLKEAEQLMRETLSIRRRTLGEEHEDVATSLNNLALLLDETGNATEPEALYRQALAIRKKLLGDEHPNIAVVLNNLGFTLRAQRRMPEAEQVFRESMAMRTKLMGETHPDTLLSMNNLGSCLQAVGKLEEAEPLYRRAIELQRVALGSDHPSLASSINNLATLLREQGKLAEAEPYFRESLAIRRKRLGETHPAVAVGMSNLSALLREREQFDEAEDLARQALAISAARFGEEHPETGVYHTQLGACLLAMKRYEEAERELLLAKRLLAPPAKIDPRRWIQCATALHKLYVTWGKPLLAEEYAAVLATTRPAASPTTVPAAAAAAR